MELVAVGFLALALTSYAWAREVTPILRRCFRRSRNVPRTGPRVKTVINVRDEKETNDDLL